jgi:uncharacterized protein (DUF927 family)
LGAEGGGFHFRGASTTGKTTAATVAGSVWGGGGVRGWLRSWRTTDNSLEAVAAAHNDLLLCLDEMGECSGEVVSACAYMLANGTGKGRANREGGARKQAEWRVLFLSTGEVGLADMLAAAQRGPRRTKAGQEVRVVDVSVDAGAGMGIFENIHGEQNAAAFARKLSAAALRLYGVAGRTFVERLLLDAEAIVGSKKAHRNFLAKHVTKDMGPQAQRVVDRFALLAAAGEAAIALGVLPFGRGDCAAAAATCLNAWRGSRAAGAGDSEAAAAISAVRHFLVAHGASRFEFLGEADQPQDGRVINRAGWRKKCEDGSWRYLIPGEVWRSEVVAGLDPRAAAATLRKAGYLLPQSEKAERHVRLERIGDGRAKVYVISDTILEAVTHPDEREELPTDEGGAQ